MKEINIRTALDRVSSTPEDIAARISGFVDEMNQREPLAWEELRSNRKWKGTNEELTAIVRRNASKVATGKPNTDDGYTLAMSAETKIDVLTVGIAVGNPFFGRQLPAQNIDGIIRARGFYKSIDPILADAMFESIITAWEPLKCEMTASEVVEAARAQYGSGRGGWKIAPGYRVWLRDGTVTVNDVAQGVERRAFAGGTLLLVPFEWPADDVARAMLQTLEMNGIDEMPHPVP